VPAFRQKSSSNFKCYQKVHGDIAINLKKDLAALKYNLSYKKRETPLMVAFSKYFTRIKFS